MEQLASFCVAAVVKLTLSIFREIEDSEINEIGIAPSIEFPQSAVKTSVLSRCG